MLFNQNAMSKNEEMYDNQNTGSAAWKTPFRTRAAKKFSGGKKMKQRKITAALLCMALVVTLAPSGQIRAGGGKKTGP